jgi:hypothetical protein
VIRGRLVAPDVEEADDVVRAWLSEEQTVVDERLSSFDVDVFDQEIGNIERERRCPQELAVASVKCEIPPPSPYHHRHVLLLAARNAGVDPFQELRFGIK